MRNEMRTGIRPSRQPARAGPLPSPRMADASTNRRPPDLYQDLSQFGLDDDVREWLLTEQSECSVVWTTADGWPVGVVHRFVWHDGRIWVACPSDRKRVKALRRDGRSCVI